MIKEIWIKLDKELLKNGKKCDNVDYDIITIQMEVHKATIQNLSSLKNEQDKICSREKKMNNLNINLKQSSNYLIQMFYKTGQKYSCTRTKIGKLLSIVAFIHARKNEKVFNEIILKYDNYGTAINELKVDVDRDVYLKCEYSDDEKYIEAVFDDSAEIPEKHQCIDELTEDIKKEIENVFRNFGAYSAYELGQLINPIVNYENVTNADNQIELSKIYTLNSDNFEKEEWNKLIEYIFT